MFGGTQAYIDYAIENGLNQAYINIFLTEYGLENAPHQNSFNQDIGYRDLSSVQSLFEMLSYSGMSQDNYDKTLKAWSVKPSSPNNVMLGSRTLIYCDTSGRDALIAKGREIKGDTHFCPVSSVALETHTVKDATLVEKPTGSVAVQSPIVAKSKLAISNITKQPNSVCSTINQANLLDPETVKAAANADDVTAGVQILGGVEFKIKCSTSAKAEINYILGQKIPANKVLKIFKLSDNKLTDITDQLDINLSGNNPTISYSVTDGGQWDEDKQANGEVVDPIYIGLVDTPKSGNNPGAGSANGTGVSSENGGSTNSIKNQSAKMSS